VTILVTRLHGHRAVLEHVLTGSVGLVWLGELRSDQDRPLPTHLEGKVGTRVVHEVRVASELGDLLRVLEKVASEAVLVSRASLRAHDARKGLRTRPTASQGRSEGTTGRLPGLYTR
jgi:hypothetical protein